MVPNFGSPADSQEVALDLSELELWDLKFDLVFFELDRFLCLDAVTGACHFIVTKRFVVLLNYEMFLRTIPVSYTHLTLPTICSV